MNLRISVYDQVSAYDLLVDYVVKALAWVINFFSDKSPEAEIIGASTEQSPEDSTGPPALGINITDNVNTGEALS